MRAGRTFEQRRLHDRIARPSCPAQAAADQEHDRVIGGSNSSLRYLDQLTAALWALHQSVARTAGCLHISATLLSLPAQLNCNTTPGPVVWTCIKRGSLISNMRLQRRCTHPTERITAPGSSSPAAAPPKEAVGPHRRSPSRRGSHSRRGWCDPCRQCT